MDDDFLMDCACYHEKFINEHKEWHTTRLVFRQTPTFIF